ncbi:MAG: dethiobiotin synthase [Pseudomonadota bacterium]
MALGYFVTGTNTEVGKTLVSCALLHTLRAQHAKVVGMKPVAAGATRTAHGWVNDDTLALRAASSLAVPPALDNPYCLPDPMSPHLAARRAGQTIEVSVLLQRYQQLAALADAVVVEGAGGFIVPLSDTETSADLAQQLALPVILVVGLRLGCINHALLTQDAVAARGLTLAGWVANRVDPTMLAVDDNIDSLRQRLRAPLLADIPYSPQPDPAQIAIGLPH